ncbi:MAG: tetratricopeptide repeat protein [bacterium]|nr:tetratricopeptide repeat protein [bacterium]
MNKYYVYTLSLFLYNSCTITIEEISAKQYRSEGNLSKAIVQYQKELEKEPNNSNLITNLADTYYDNSNISAAITCYQKALMIDPNNAHIHNKLGLCYLQSKNFDQALFHISQAITHNPHDASSYIYLGTIYAQKNQYEKSLAYYQKALQIAPNNVNAYYWYGKALKALNLCEAAREQFNIVRTINPQNTSNLLELGNTLNILNKNDDAISTYMEILALNPNNYIALYNIGYTLKKQGHFKEAGDIFEKIIAVKPGYAAAHFSLALALLTMGEFERGWQEYEWRWKNYNEVPKQFTDPVWDGCDPKGKTIFVYAEQGLSDTLQFIRYAKLLKERGATIIFETQKPLVPLLLLCPYLDKVVTQQDPTVKFDFHIALMSLPLIFNTTVETIPAEIPYLYASEQLVDQWKEKLAHDTHFKIGICWHGNVHYKLPALKTAMEEKSITLESFAPLANIKGVSLYSLQKNDDTQEIEAIHDSFTVHTFAHDFDETHGRFMDTAALIKNLDLVITIDTAIAHLAGGLGVPTWLLLPEPADWRWLLRTDTPWYPNMRLFRQPERGNWHHVIQKVVDALSTQLHTINENNESLVRETIEPRISVEEVTDQITQPHLIKRSVNQEYPAAEYQNYLEKYPAIGPLVESLTHTNNQLYELGQQLTAPNFNVYDAQCIEIARKACYTHDMKVTLKQTIQDIIDSSKQ